MSDRKSRWNARVQARNNDMSAPIVTNDDRAHMEAYASKIDEATAVIRDEMNAIMSGEMSAVSDIYPKKAEILKWLELRGPVVEPLLKLDIAKEYHLQTRLAVLKQVLEQDELMLKHLAAMAASISREIEKVIHRDSLDGLYGQSGEKLSALSAPRKSLDHEI